VLHARAVLSFELFHESSEQRGMNYVVLRILRLRTTDGSHDSTELGGFLDCRRLPAYRDGDHHG
jgi:hypothetical protein